MRSLFFIGIVIISASSIASVPYLQPKDSSGNKVYNEWLGLKTSFFAGPAMCNMRSPGTFLVGDFSWKMTAGVGFQFDLSKIWAMEYDIQLIGKGYILNDSVNDIQGNFLSRRTVKTHCSYMSFPVLFKINLRNKTAAFISFGGYLATQLSSKQTTTFEDLSAGGPVSERGFNSFALDGGTILSFGSEFGFGNYQIGLELRGEIGFMNVDAPAGYPYQHHIAFSLLSSVKYKKPKSRKIFKGAGDL